MPDFPSEECIILRPPLRNPVDRPAVILYGTIESSTPHCVEWRSQVMSTLSDLPIAILNPLRCDWDDTWVEDISSAMFREQVEWEMDHARLASVIMFYFGSSSLAPVTMLELGMYADTGKAVVCCSPEFSKRGNVQIVCQRYNIPLFDHLDEAKEHVRQRLIANVSDASQQR